MVYLLKMVIFHGYVSHNQMVYSLKSHYYPLIIIIDIIIPFVSNILPIFSRHSRNTTIDTFGIWWKSMKPVTGTPTRKILPPSNFSSAWPGLKPRCGEIMGGNKAGQSIVSWRLIAGKIIYPLAICYSLRTWKWWFTLWFYPFFTWWFSMVM